MPYYIRAKGCWAVDIPPRASWTGKRLKPQFKDEAAAEVYELEVKLALAKGKIVAKPSRPNKKKKRKTKTGGMTSKQREYRQLWRTLLTEVFQDRWKHHKTGKVSQLRAEAVCEWLGYPNPEKTTMDDLRKIKNWRLETVKATTWNKELSAFSVIIKHGFDTERINSFPRLPFAPQKIIDQQKTRRVYIRGGLYEKVVQVIKESRFEKYLEYFETLFDVAARRGELLNLRISEIDTETREFFFYATKNGRDRSMPYSSHIADIVNRRLKRQDVQESRKLFPEMTPERHRKTWDYVRTTLYERGVIPEEYLEPNKFVPYGLRHGQATEIYEKTDGDIRLVQDVLGHKSITTTEIYAHVSSSHKRNKLGR